MAAANAGRSPSASADLQRDGDVVGEARGVRPGAQHPASIVRNADEGARVSLLAQPFQILQVVGMGFANSLLQAIGIPGLLGFAVDLLRRAVARDDLEQVVDDARVGIEQQRVDRIESIRRNGETLTQFLFHGRPPCAESCPRL
jgi:hypothetical protein